jgi:hypothetical protein
VLEFPERDVSTEGEKGGEKGDERGRGEQRQVAYCTCLKIMKKRKQRGEKGDKRGRGEAVYIQSVMGSNPTQGSSWKKELSWV